MTKDVQIKLGQKNNSVQELVNNMATLVLGGISIDGDGMG
jgi:hypothetical protein